VSEDIKICFSCAEEIKLAALVCKHCGQRQSDDDREKFEGKQPSIAKQKPKRKPGVFVASGLLAMGLGVGGYFLAVNYLDAAEKDAAARESIKALCGDILYGSWKNVALQDVVDAGFGYAIGKYSPWEAFEAANLSDYQNNADQASRLKRPSYPNDEKLKVTWSNLNTAAQDLRMGWSRLATDAIPSYLGAIKGDSSADDEFQAVEDEMAKVKDAIQLATIECEAYVAG
jgi:hypothetical protein